MLMKFLGTLAGRAVAILALLLLIVGAVALSQCRSARNAKTEARLSDNQAGAVSQSAQDAIGTVGAVSGRSTETDDLTRTNEQEIRAAEGADATVGAVGSAGLQALCRRAAYANDPRCVG